jgi:hypothetical protein
MNAHAWPVSARVGVVEAPGVVVPTAPAPIFAPEPRSALLEGAGEAVRTPHGPAPADAATEPIDRYRCAEAELDRVICQTD